MKDLVKILVIPTAILMIVYLLFAGIYFNREGVETQRMLTGSMTPTIKVGGTVYIDTNYPFEDLQFVSKGSSNNDIVCIKWDDQHYVVTHRIYDKIEGMPGYFTKGDANESIDITAVTPENYVGKVIGYTNITVPIYDLILKNNA